MASEQHYRAEIRHIGIDILRHVLAKAERRERRTGGTDKAWVVDAIRDEIVRRDAPQAYADRVRELEAEGLTTSDAQSVADAEGGWRVQDTTAYAMLSDDDRRAVDAIKAGKR